jgi:hypothetical protein
MTTVLGAPTTALGGLPFLNDGFVSTRLLAAVAAVRHVQAERIGAVGDLSDAQAEAWLAPARAFMLRRGGPPMPAAPLTPRRRGMVADAVEGLGVAVPGWEPLLRLPVRFALLEPPNGAISASSRMWPQHVLLAEEAFATARELAEQVVHELCHQWLYLIEEVWALEVPDARRATLPSGTADRSPAEVLGAAHVAAALVRLYRAGADAPPDRIGRLSQYGDHCLGLLDGMEDDLTEAGRDVARRLREAL